MNEPFYIPVHYDGKEHEFKARFERWGYTHRISVLISDTTVVFEPDEEGGYRALRFDGSATVNPLLLETLAKKLVKLIE
jgi:hypothetical protein